MLALRSKDETPGLLLAMTREAEAAILDKFQADVASKQQGFLYIKLLSTSPAPSPSPISTFRLSFILAITRVGRSVKFLLISARMKRKDECLRRRSELARWRYKIARFFGLNEAVVAVIGGREACARQINNGFIYMIREGFAKFKTIKNSRVFVRHVHRQSKYKTEIK